MTFEVTGELNIYFTDIEIYRWINYDIGNDPCDDCSHWFIR